MRNILVLCDAFPPAFAPRMGYLCKYLPAFGWQPIVFSEWHSKNYYAKLAENQKVEYINFFYNKKGKFSKLKYFFVFFADYFFDYKKLKIKKRAKKILEQHQISAILSSNSFRIYFAKAAMELAQNYNIPFVLDIRDIFEQFPNSEYASRLLVKSSKINSLIDKHIKKHFILQRNSILPKADIITSVSEWHCSFLSKFNSNVKLIYNGFDDELFKYKQVTAEKFKIAYVGRIESLDVKNPTLFFEAIKAMKNRQMIDKEWFIAEFYLINEFSKNLIKTFAQQFDIEEFITINNTIDNSQVPEILNNSSVLLLLANKADGNRSPKGILGTKLFEYLAVEKPVLCVKSDESYMQQIINQANAGVAYSDVEQIIEFLHSKIGEWQTQHFTHQAINKEFVQQLSRKEQAKQFLHLFGQLNS